MPPSRGFRKLCYAERWLNAQHGKRLGQTIRPSTSTILFLTSTDTNGSSMKVRSVQLSKTFRSERWLNAQHGKRLGQTIRPSTSTILFLTSTDTNGSSMKVRSVQLSKTF